MGIDGQYVEENGRISNFLKYFKFNIQGGALPQRHVVGESLHRIGLHANNVVEAEGC